MRTTRAFIAGLGTTGSLVAGAACVFLVASAVIAFKGWPGAGLADRIDSLFVDDSTPVAWDRPGTEAVAAGAAAAAAAVAPTAAGPTFGAPDVALGGDGGAVQGAGRRLPDGTIAPVGASGPGATGQGTPAGSSAPGVPSLPSVDTGGTQNQVADTVQQTTGGVGRTVGDTSRDVGQTVGGPVGDTVSQTGDTVGNTVDSVGQGVGEVLSPSP